MRSVLRPISDSVGELIGRGKPRAAAVARPVGRRASQASRSSAARDAFRRKGELLAQSDFFEHLVPVSVCLLLVAAAVVSSLPGVKPASAAGRPSANPATVAAANVMPAKYGLNDGPNADYNDLYFGDGSISNTMQNPGVGTDAKTMLLTYVVQPGDTLNKIAGRFGLAAPTIYWANKSQLPDPSSLRVGQQLLVPPIDGLLVKVGTKDTLDTLAAKYKVSAQDIIDTNNLPEPSIVLGQTLLIPGASGGPMPKARTATSSSGGSSGMRWPVGGTNYYVSQYYWSGHRAIDIAAPYGTPVIAAASGTVIYSGWRSTIGGGNVIWVQDGTKLFTTYNHLSWWGVRVGQRITAGQVIGRVGTSGEATGPHLHFEVWLGYPWALGTTATTANPCNYLAGC